MSRLQRCARRLCSSGSQSLHVPASLSVAAARAKCFSTSVGSAKSAAAKSTTGEVPLRRGAAMLAVAGVAGGLSLIMSYRNQLGEDAPHLLPAAQAQAASRAGSEAACSFQSTSGEDCTAAAADGTESLKRMMAAAPAEQPASAPGWWASLTGGGAAAAASEPQPANGNAGTRSSGGGGDGGSMTLTKPAADAAKLAAAAAPHPQPKQAGSGGSGDRQTPPAGAVQGAEAEEAEGWWAWLKSSVGAAPAPAPPVYVPLPTDKLCCKLPADRRSGAKQQPVVLLACGSFNPPTIAHLRMFELASDALREEGYDVLGGYMSPVNDAYGKPDLAPATHRVHMAELAAATSDTVMVDPWEAAQPGWQRTLAVMRRLSVELSGMFDIEQAEAGVADRPTTPVAPPVSRTHPDADSSDAADFPGSHDGAAASAGNTASGVPAGSEAAVPPPPAAGSSAGPPPQPSDTPAAAAQPPAQVLPPADDSDGSSSGSGGTAQNAPQVMLLCGADLVESFATPGVWKREHLQQIMGPEHGVVCIARRGAEVRQLVAPGSGGSGSNALGGLASGIRIIEDPVALDVSSSKLRAAIEQGKSVKYLTTDAVLAYIKTHRLYYSAAESDS